MCVFVSRPMKFVTSYEKKNGEAPKLVVDFLRKNTFRKQKSWKSSRILSEKVTTTTANSENRRGFCVSSFSSFFISFLHFSKCFLHFLHVSASCFFIFLVVPHFSEVLFIFSFFLFLIFSMFLVSSLSFFFYFSNFFISFVFPFFIFHLLFSIFFFFQWS